VSDDQYFLRKAVEVGNQKPVPYNFGAVIVKDGHIIAAEHNHVHELHDPSAHAEISALKAAAKKLGTHNLDGCIMYGSHEPCLMCFSCAAWAHVQRVVYAVAANEQDFMYEFDGISLKDIAEKLTRKMTVDHIIVKE
jgi:tRNA(Arg) A34 adenosine deaminase TadA